MALIRRVYKRWTIADIRKACELYLVTGDAWLGARTLHSCVAEAIVGGATFVQLRNSTVKSIERIRRARDLASVCRVANIPIVIDDDIEAAKAAGVDGIHIERGCLTCAQARAELGPDAIVGMSVKTVDEAIESQNEGASYLSVGPVFATAKNRGVGIIPLDTLKEITSAVMIPVIAIGGINTSNVADLASTGIDGVAALSAIMASPDIEDATRRLKTEVETYIKKDSRI